MKLGDNIRFFRKGNNIYKKKWSQEELGTALNPPVKRAAINKWETGAVENLKATHIQQLALLFGVTPCELMGFDDQVPSNTQSPPQGMQMLDQLQEFWGKDAIQLLQLYNQLNESGKEKVVEFLNDLVGHPKYINK